MKEVLNLVLFSFLRLILYIKKVDDEFDRSYEDDNYLEEERKKIINEKLKYFPYIVNLNAIFQMALLRTRTR